MATGKLVRVVTLSVLALLYGSVDAEQVIDENSVGSSSATISFASHIAQAANLSGVLDQELFLPEDTLDGTRSAASRSLDLGMAAGTASGAFTSGAVSPGMGASLWVISALLASRGSLASEAYSRLFVWMPLEKASNKSEATGLLTSLYVDAVQNALPDHSIEKIKPGIRNGGLRGLSLKISGPKCPDGCIQPVFYIDDPETGKAPAILGGYDAYVWKVKGGNEKSNFIPQGKRYFPMSQEELTKKDRVTFYQEISTRLPRWVFLYIAPHEKGSPVPVIFHKGKPHYFIKPQFDSISAR
ncbi:MAG: hypothetical protein AB2598_19415 [Candidatus Thiodiazotropha sp.]